jgi:hypothetical protein
MTDPRVTKTSSLFNLTCVVETHIAADPAAVWKLLTDVAGFPQWNSTVSGIEGRIRGRQRLTVRVPGSNRAFTPVVSGFVPDRRMTWTGGFAPMFQGVRTFELKPRSDGSTDFTMEERFSGLMLPMIKSSLPDFGPIFERYATDLKRAAEGR